MPTDAPVMPALPAAEFVACEITGRFDGRDAYSAEQMHAYAREYAAALAAAPAEGVQPVAWMPGISLLYLAEDGGWSRVEGKRSGMFDTPLYATPQAEAAGVPESERLRAIARDAAERATELQREVLQLRAAARDSQAPAAPAAPVDALPALQAARQFIINGVGFGYIRMPDADTPDSAHDTLPLIEATIAALSRPQAEQERTRSQKLSDAGFERRPTWKSLPSDADDDEAQAEQEPT
jgi:hypothetical protein